MRMLKMYKVLNNTAIYCNDCCQKATITASIALRSSSFFWWLG